MAGAPTPPNPAPPTASSSPTPSSGPTAQPSPPARRRPLAIVAGVVVAAVLLVLALGVAGVVPIFPSSSSGPSGALTYDQALPLANAAEQGTAGGPWGLILGSGIDPSATVSENLTGVGSSDCNFTLLPGVGSTITVSSASGNRTGGSAMAWVFVYKNLGGAVLIVGVIGGKATAIGSIAAGQECSTIFELFSKVPSSVIDSSVAAGDVQADAAAFLAAHPNVTAQYGLVGGVMLFGHGVGSEWEVNYTTCPTDAVTGTPGSSFNATVNATTGAVLHPQTNPSFTCPASSSITLLHGSSASTPRAASYEPLALTRGD